MATSVYDMGDIWNLVREYKNKRRLSGGYPLPAELEAIYKGGLTSMYSNLDRKKEIALNEKNADRNYDLSMQQLALNRDAMRLKEDALDAQKKQALMSGLTSLVPAGIALYKTGKDEGWWGNPKSSPTPQYNYSGGSVYDTAGNDISGYDWTYGDDIPTPTYTPQSPAPSTGGDVWDWVKDIIKWVLPW